LLEGAAHVRTACPFPEAAARFCGAVGVVIGVADTAGEDAGPVPTLFVAVTVAVYVVPFVRFEIVIGPDVPVKIETPFVFAGDIVTV